MIKLSNVSKYYHNEGIVTLALHKINLEFELGEFVAITGESGSGKSTLLNVIAGIDSYEEGELYINGEETSYYDDDDWEGYRKDKIAFVFQNYNLIDSYTVLKNVEVALVIQGLSKKERIARAIDIIEKVGLKDHLKHRAAKLSGGQKQRLAIARALAKETNIIVADEPTGNLDSESGKQVLELLNEIAKNKLVFIVTHNFEQSSAYVSRKIRLFDGEVVEDKHLKNHEQIPPKQEEAQQTKDIVQAVTIAKFNIFSQPKKSIFLFLVSFSVIFFVFYFYSIMIGLNDLSNSDMFYNYSSINNYPERIILAKKDRTKFTQAELDTILADKRIDKLIEEDRALDNTLTTSYYVSDRSFYFDGQIQYNIKTTNDSLVGRFPENEDEIVLNIYYYDKTDAENIDWLIGRTMEFYINNYNRNNFYGDYSSGTINLKIVGINKRSFESKDGYYVLDSTFSKIHEALEYAPKDRAISVYKQDGSSGDVIFLPVFLDETLSGMQARLDNYTLPSDWYIELENVKLNIVSSSNSAGGNMQIFLSKDYYDYFFSVDELQVSVNLKNVNDRSAVEKSMYNQGFYTFSPATDIKSMDYNTTLNAIIGLIYALVYLFFMFILYLISYLIYKLIMNTKIKDYTILRVIGAKKTTISNIIRIELFASFIIAYLVFFVVYLFIQKYLNFLENLKALDYILVLIINIALSLLIARRFILKQVQKSLYTNLRAE